MRFFDVPDAPKMGQFRQKQDWDVGAEMRFISCAEPVISSRRHEPPGDVYQPFTRRFVDDFFTSMLS